MTISIYDNGAYIRVVDDATSVIVNYVKSTLVIQKDNSNSFFLKNDNYITYYNYADVITPASNDLDQLLSILTGWNVTAPSTTFDTSLMDSFSRLRVSTQPNVQLKIQNVYDSNSLQIDELTTSNAISSYNTYHNAVNMIAIPAVGSRIVRQSKLYPTHTHGSTSLAIVNGTLTTNVTNSNMTTKIGVFDDSNDIVTGIGGNGIFFKYNNSSNLSLVYRTNYGGSQVDYEVSQNSWNVDSLNGAGVSGQILSPSQPTNFVFEWNQVYKPKNVRVGIFNNGVNYCHVFSNMPPFGNPSLPVRWEIGHDSNLGEPNTATCVQGPATVYTDASYIGTYNTFSYSRTEFVTMSTPGNMTPLLSIRAKQQYNRAKIVPIEVEVTNVGGGGVGKWNLFIRSVLDTPTWTPISDSYVEIDESSAGTTTDGTLLACGYFVDAGVTKVSLTDKQIELLSSINGLQDILTIRVDLIYGTINTSASITWNERD